MTPVSLLRTRARLQAATVTLALAAGALVAAAPPAAAQTTPGPCPVLENASFEGTLTEGSMRLGSRISATGLTGAMCGLFEFDGQQQYVATIDPSHIGLAGTTTRIGLLRLTTTLTVPRPATLRLLVTGPGGPRPAALSGDLDVTFALGGSRCTTRISPLHVITGQSGALRGQDLANDTTGDLVGRIVANAFPVPAVAASSSCSARTAGLVNSLVGLPAAAGVSSFDYRIRIGPNI